MYKGAAPAVADLMAGSVPMVVAPMSDMLEYHKAGRLKIVAVISALRSVLGAEETAKVQRSEHLMWGPFVKASGFSPED